MGIPIENQLDAYAQALERAEMLQAQMQELLDKVPVPQEIVDQWNAIKAEFQPMIDTATEAATLIKTGIEQEVLKLGATVKGDKYMAVWNKGRSSWDGKALEGFAMAHPEILQAKKVGEPTVTFRKVK